MRFDLDGLEVFFPYDFLYKEQFEYMLQLKKVNIIITIINIIIIIIMIIGN